jgi:hypothetical protein
MGNPHKIQMETVNLRALLVVTGQKVNRIKGVTWSVTALF